MVALSGVSLALHAERPTITAVVGESGSGKTTLARVLLGLTAPSPRGRCCTSGQDLATLTGERPPRLPPRRAGRVPGSVRGLQPILSRGPCAHHAGTPASGSPPSRAEGRLLIEDSLRAVGLRPEEILGRFPHQLSGGQRQRIMVARAVLMRPACHRGR